ncbi:MAG TPA: hypothetical protein VIF15_09065 [Polyangiaceae bacterium]
MSQTRLARWLLAWAIATAVACAVVHHAFVLDVDEAHPRVVVASVWRDGALLARAVLARAADRDPRLDAALSASPGAVRVDESIVGEGPALAFAEPVLALSFVPGRDGMKVTLGDRTEYLTPDDLLARQGYDKGISVPSVQLQAGVDVPLALALLAERFGTSARDLVERARFRRIRVVRSVPGTPSPRVVTADDLRDDDVREAIAGMARYLARGVDEQGRFRYLVNAPTNQTLPGYDWPRHAGATLFLAQATALLGDADLGFATLRSASWLRDHALVRCGTHSCIGDDALVDVGSAALATLAFVEIARTRLDPGYALAVPELTEFLRSQQRPDGEFMHEYDRATGHPVDVQLLYYSGEAVLALSRAHALLGDARDLDAATRGLAHLVGPAWSFFGSRYYWGEEHWTCQAMDDLWDRAPSQPALDFCLGWQAYGRRLMYGPGDSPFDADGAYGFGPVVTPRLTPVGSRSEAGIATLEAAMRAGRPAAELALLDAQMRRSLAVLIRHQLHPGPSYLFVDPLAVDGAMPGSAVDWQLRIDYEQHSGCALVRWLALRHPHG